MIQTLYKRAKNGKVQQWTIEVRFEKFRTTEGYVDGTLTPTEWTVCKGKRAGASNATTPEEQALKEAVAKVKKQRDKGWADNVESIDAAAPEIKPMLAFEKSKYEDDLYSWDLIGSQPKLDGIRCVATKDGLKTRNGKPINSAPHIMEALQAFFFQYGELGVKLDGELYNHDLKDDFNQITSIVRKMSPTDLDLEKSAKILQYHIYDIDFPNMEFHERNGFIKNTLEPLIDSNIIKIVPTWFFYASTDEAKTDEMNRLFALYIEDGYEGQMLRNGNSQYDHFRSKNLLKHKEFMTDEFEIIDIEEGVGNRSGMMGRIKFDGFDSNARGTHEFFKDLLINKDNYIGKVATVRFQNYTPDGVPRFPVMIAIRDYE